MPKKDQLVRHKEAQRRRRRRIQNPSNLELSEEKVRLDKNAWGDITPIKLEPVISKKEIQEQGRIVENSTIEAKPMEKHCEEKNDEGLLHRVRMFFRREKSANDADQKLTKNNEENVQNEGKIHKLHSKKNEEKRSKSRKSKNKSPELEPNSRKQETIEQKPLRDVGKCLEVKDLYRRKKPDKTPKKEHKSNAQTVEILPQPPTEKEARKKENHETKIVSEDISCLGQYEKYFAFIKPAHSEPDSKITKHKPEEKSIIKEESSLTTESIKIKLEEKIIHELQEDLMSFSSHLESIFNKKFDMFLRAYEQQREQKKKEKKERANSIKRKTESCQNPKEAIINEILQRLINENSTIVREIPAKEHKSQKLPLKDSSCQATSEIHHRRLAKINSSQALHVVKKENRLDFLKISKDDKTPKKCNKSLLACGKSDVGDHKIHKERFRSLKTDLPAKSTQDNEEIHLLTLKKPQRLLNCHTIPIVNIFSEIPNASLTKYHIENQNSFSSSKVPKPRHKDEDECDILPPGNFKKPTKHLICDTVPIINIFPETPKSIHSEVHKESRKSSGRRNNISKQKHEDNEEIIISPPQRFKNMNYHTIPIINIVSESIQTEYPKDNRNSSHPTKPRKRHKDSEEIVILLPAQFKHSQGKLYCNPLSVINILPETINAIKAKNREAKQKCPSSERKNNLPRHANSKEIIILPPKFFKNPPKELKHDTLSIITIFPKIPKTIQTQTSYKCSQGKNLVEKRKKSKRFQSYYQYPMKNNSGERPVDFSSIVSDSYRNVLGSSGEEEPPKLEEIYFGPQSLSSSNDSNRLKNIGTEHWKQLPSSDESLMSILVARSSYCRILTSTSCDYGEFSNVNSLQIGDGCSEDVRCRPNSADTSSRNYVKSSKCVQDTTNKPKLRTFLDSEKNVRVFKHRKTKPDKSSASTTIEGNIRKQFNSIHKIIDQIQEQMNSIRKSSANTTEASVGSTMLNKGHLNGNIDNPAAMYKIINSFEDEVKRNFREPVETVDAAIGSETLKISQEKEYREMSVGTTQVDKRKSPRPRKMAPVSPIVLRRNAVVSASGTDNKAPTNKSRIPVQQFKAPAISPRNFAKNAVAQPLAEIPETEQAAINTGSSAGTRNARPHTSPRKEACTYPVKPQTSIAKPPPLSVSKPISPLNSPKNNIQASKTSENQAVEKSKSDICRGENSKTKLMEKFTNVAQTRVKYKTTIRYDTNKNDPAIAEVSTYEKRKQYDRELREIMKNKKKQKPIKNTISGNQNAQSSRPICNPRFETFHYRKPSTNLKVEAVLNEAEECIDDCLNQIQTDCAVSSNITKKLIDELQELPVITNMLNDIDNLACGNPVEFIYSSSKYSLNTSSSQGMRFDDDNQKSFDNFRLKQNISCPNLIKSSSTFEYLYEAPTTISSSSSDNI